ncbi:centrosomal protein of 152 kDa [Chanos chanos]|uniref:Centrosomal protein of 152 kDa n=1 Tax=Chanos chanos TaxID=29144 RepID=A0A6J2UME5_CHACN|nr:centrosomal protein of 152 kDa [Chanos chanos]
MSIDFDSAALQTQHDEEEYDQEDYAREQELHKLLTDLPDDMLEDSRDCSSPELDYSDCSHHDNDDRQQHGENGQIGWPHQSRPASPEENYEENYGEGSYHEDYPYENGTARLNGHANHLHNGTEHLAQGWEHQQDQDYQHDHGGTGYSSIDTEQGGGENDFSAGEGYAQEPYHHAVVHPGREYHRGEGQGYGDHASVASHFQNFDNERPGNKAVDCYKASYNPHQAARQPGMFNPQTAHQDSRFDHLQRDFLDSKQNTVESQRLAQLQIINKAQLRQIEDLEQKLEDSRRKIRYLEHQFAIVKDEKEGLAVSLKESSHLIEESKERESQLQGKIKSLERQVQALTEREQESVKKQRVAEAAVDSMQQQMMELCRSETLTRAREQHDRDMTAMREQHEARLLSLQQKLDAQTQALQEQMEAGQRLREQVRQLERQREGEQVERAAIINTLTQQLEQSQQQCAKLLQTGSVQEMSQIQMKLQQAQSALSISDNMNKTLQEELSDLKEQITLYESAIRHGAVTLEVNGDWEQHLSDSYVELGIKKAHWKNSRLHSTPLISEVVDSSSLPKEDVVRELKSELQRCLSCLKSKRQRISQLQQELQTSQRQVEELHTQLDQAEIIARDSKVKETSLEKHLEATNMAASLHQELAKLQEERQHLQDRVESLEKQNKELKQSEDKVKAANAELCTKMREMIQELDQEKQEATERYERTQQQFRDDVVNRVRLELTQEHAAQLEQINSLHQQEIQQLESKVAELSQEVLAVQECYISVCKEKDKLEENLQSQIEAEKKEKENEIRRREECEASLQRLKADLDSRHQEDVERLKAQWAEEKQVEIELQVTSQLAAAKQAWHKKQDEVERAWTRRLEEAVEESRKVSSRATQEEASQTSSPENRGKLLTMEEVEAQLSAQRATLQREAETAQERSVDEAVRRMERELQQKHLEDLSQQVEEAVSRAHARWLQNLTSLPEYKAALQTEREEWDRLQQQRVQEQMFTSLRTAEDRWQESVRETREELEESQKRIGELQEEVRCLKLKLELLREEYAAELAKAQETWIRDKKEEISRLCSQNQQEKQTLQQHHQTQLEQRLEQLREEMRRRTHAEIQEVLRSREEEWRAEQEHRLQQQRCQGLEELLAELGEVFEELRREGVEKKGSSREGQSLRSSTAASGSSLRAQLKDACRETLTKTLAHAKQEWRRSSEERLRRVLKETQERHEKEINQMNNSVAQQKEEACNRKSCTETGTKLQKKIQELQKHLEKACRQLQQTVRQHKTTLQKLKEEHEEALQKERESNLQTLEELKQSVSADSPSGGQQALQAGLEEMKEQYMKAVEKIRGDMLRYLQESKERAAELIRVEVQRERQDTARRMRRYYLTCLQELLDDGGQTAGAEKKIMNAASKLAAMAKVLETPMSKKRLVKNQNSQGGALKREGAIEGHPGEILGAISGQSVSASAETRDHHTRVEKIHHSPPLTDNDRMTGKAKLSGTKSASKSSHLGHLKTGRLKSPKDSDTKPNISQPLLQSFKHTSLIGSGPSSAQCVFNADTSVANVTVRQQGRETYLPGMESRRSDDRLTGRTTVEPFHIEEPPVKDDGQREWSLSSSSGSDFSHQIPLSSFPGKRTEPVKPFSVTARSAEDLDDFGSLLGENSDATVYKEIVKGPPYSQLKSCTSTGIHGSREPIPGFEGEEVSHRLCSKNLFSELTVHHQDSGFDSPQCLLQK